MNYAILSTVSLEGRRQAMDSSGWVLQMNLCYLCTDEVKKWILCATEIRLHFTKENYVINLGRNLL